jgi:transcriptional regulator with XRE-family HTH domain
MIKNYNRQFGENVRALRVQMNWSQEELAEHSGLHRTYISGVERGIRNPTLSIVVRIAIALKVQPSLLIPVVVLNAKTKSH